MNTFKFTYKLTLTCAWLVYFICNLYLVQSVEIECIPLESCPTLLKLIATNKYAPETIELLRNSHCGFDGKGQAKVWCSQLNFCKTPNNRNGTCTPIKKCKPFLELRASLDPADVSMEKFLNPYRCNTILKKVHVCCPHEELPIRPDYPDYEESTSIETMLNKPKLFVSVVIPDMRNRFGDLDYEDGNAYGWLGDQPEYYHHQDRSTSDMFSGNMHPPSTRNMHEPWSISNRHELEQGWVMPKPFHDHGFEHSPERWNVHGTVGAFGHHIQMGIPHHIPHHNAGNNPSNFSNKRGTDTEGHTNRGTTEENSWDSSEHTTPKRRTRVTTEHTTIRNHEHATAPGSRFDRTTRRSGRKPQGKTTPSSWDSNETTEDHTTRRGWKTEEQTTSTRRPWRSTKKYDTEGTTRGSRWRPQQTTPDEDSIIFEDSSETNTNKNSWNTPEQTTRRENDNRRNDQSNRNCETPEKKSGICTKQSNCQPYLKLQNNLDKSKKSIREYLNKFKCNSTSTREIYVCCQVDEEKDIDNSVFSAERTNENVPEPYSKICGRQTANSDRIFGGTSAGLGEFPWIALLQYPSNKGLMSGCGGTLINSRYVLTAAHCVDEEILKTRKLQPLRQIVLGEYDTRNETDCIYMQYGQDCAPPPKKYGIDSIISHNLYSSDTTRHDIALVRLNQEVEFTDYIKPVCLPTNSSTLNGNETFVIAGWGRTPTEMSSPVLKKAKLPFVQKQNCNARNTNSRTLIDGQICAGRGNGSDSCNGDSGGPLMLEVNFNFEFVTHLVGIISYGFGECGNGPSVNTYIPYYIDWINDNIR